jgi:hypothetical protein
MGAASPRFAAFLTRGLPIMHREGEARSGIPFIFFALTVMTESYSRTRHDDVFLQEHSHSSHHPQRRVLHADLNRSLTHEFPIGIDIERMFRLDPHARSLKVLDLFHSQMPPAVYRWEQGKELAPTQRPHHADV